jgi:predicted nicotinamide N-methyase
VPVFLERNLKKNQISAVSFEKIDWRGGDKRCWDFILASDVLYDRVQPEALLLFLESHLMPGGTILIADPGRPYWEKFTNLLRSKHWLGEESLQDSIFFLRATKAFNDTIRA